MEIADSDCFGLTFCVGTLATWADTEEIVEAVLGEFTNAGLVLREKPAACQTFFEQHFPTDLL